MCECHHELAAMRARMRSLTDERNALYHGCHRDRARLDALVFTTRLIDERTRGLSLELATPIQAGGYLVLRNTLKGTPMQKPITYVVTARKMHEHAIAAEGEAPHPDGQYARAVEVMLSVSGVPNPQQYAPIVLNFTGPQCALASEYALGARFELRRVEPTPPMPLPELDRKVEVKP